MARADIIGDLLRRASVAAPDLLAADVAAALHEAGGHHLVLYVVDYEQEQLCPLAIASDLLAEAPTSVAVAGTLAGRAFQTQELVVSRTADGWRVWAPIHQRSERIGVLELGFAALDDEVLALSEDLGRLVGHLIRTASRYTDAVEMCRRRRGMRLAAEIQWDMLLPPLSFCAPDVSIAGLLEPAYDIGGDAFDYALNGETLGFAFLDAMGHGLRSAMSSTLALAGFRHGRRRGLDLVEIAGIIDEALQDEFDGESFVTGHLVRLDTGSGELTWINAGHPDPLVIRGGRVVGSLHAEPCLPLGLGIKIAEVGHAVLQAGDALLFYSDGVVEARPDGGDQYGVTRLERLVEQQLSDRLPAAEVLRRIVRTVRDHRADDLRDDATLVLLEFQPTREPVPTAQRLVNGLAARASEPA